MKKILLTIIVLIFLVSCGKLPETFKVLYYTNGSTSGTQPTDNKKYKSGEYATVLGKNTLEKTGYNFGGWNTKADNSGDHHDEGDEIEIININIFLFPVWEEN